MMTSKADTSTWGLAGGRRSDPFTLCCDMVKEATNSPNATAEKIIGGQQVELEINGGIQFWRLAGQAVGADDLLSQLEENSQEIIK